MNQDVGISGGPSVQGGASPAAESVHERQRRAITALIPRWYNPWVHLATPTLIGLTIVTVALSQLRALRPIEILAVPVSLLLAFLFEWHAHKYVLHRRTRGVTIIYDRHELQHHVVYTHDDMVMRDRREFWLILVPAYAVVLIFVVACPLAFVIAQLVSVNASLLFLASSMAFFVSYEWLHLAYHAADTSVVGRFRVIALLREHHRLHHDPRLMKRWNFNVTVPVFDWVFRTNWAPGRERSRRPQKVGTPSHPAPRAS